jgi:hypothetical protein
MKRIITILFSIGASVGAVIAVVSIVSLIQAFNREDNYGYWKAYSHLYSLRFGQLFFYVFIPTLAIFIYSLLLKKQGMKKE